MNSFYMMRTGCHPCQLGNLNEGVREFVSGLFFKIRGAWVSMVDYVRGKRIYELSKNLSVMGERLRNVREEAVATASWVLNGNGDRGDFLQKLGYAIASAFREEYGAEYGDQVVVAAVYLEMMGEQVLLNYVKEFMPEVSTGVQVREVGYWFIKKLVEELQSGKYRKAQAVANYIEGTPERDAFVIMDEFDPGMIYVSPVAAAGTGRQSYSEFRITDDEVVKDYRWVEGHFGFLANIRQQKGYFVLAERGRPAFVIEAQEGDLRKGYMARYIGRLRVYLRDKTRLYQVVFCVNDYPDGMGFALGSRDLSFGESKYEQEAHDMLAECEEAENMDFWGMAVYSFQGKVEWVFAF